MVTLSLHTTATSLRHHCTIARPSLLHYTIIKPPLHYPCDVGEAATWRSLLLMPHVLLAQCHNCKACTVSLLKRSATDENSNYSLGGRGWVGLVGEGMGWGGGGSGES